MPRLVMVLTILGAMFCLSFSYSQDLPEKYFTYDEVLDSITILATANPNIMFIDTLGYSTTDSVPMLRVKLSDNPTVDEDEPAIFLNSGVHADELMGPEVNIHFLGDIIARYNNFDQDAASYIHGLEIFVVPFVNPEGHIELESGNLDWRKNKSDNDTNGVFSDYDGVDNNRNYDFGWSIDDDTEPSSLMFKGYAPFTESENLAMAAFGWKYRPVIAIDYHTPTYGRPNVAYYPWYWYASEGGSGFGPDENMMQSICEDYTAEILAIPDDSGTVTYTARRALVNKGDLKTYFYGNFGTVAFTVEITDTTLQDTALVDSIVAAHLPGTDYLLERALGPGISGIIRDSVTMEPLEAEVQVTQHINDDINPRLSRPDFGRYRRLLSAGSYTLRFIKTGYQTKTISGVSVNSSDYTVTDVLLIPDNPRPPAPVLIYPVNHDTLEVDTLTLNWNESDLADEYLLELAVDVDFENIFIVDSSLTATEFNLGEGLEDGDYYWRIRASNENGWGPYTEHFHFNIDFVSSVDEHGVLTPESFKLNQNHPNPFNASTQISFTIPIASQVNLEIFDVTGSLVNRIVDTLLPAGAYSYIWNGVDFKSIMIYRVNQHRHLLL